MKQDNDIRARIYRQISPAAIAYGEWKGWIISRTVLTAIDNGKLAIGYLVEENGVRWYHVYLCVIERWAAENNITIPKIDPAPTEAGP